MAIYELIITDVTCYGTLFCVAGWDRINGGMIRPEPADANIVYEPSRFWGSQKAGPGKFFSVGNIVRIEAAASPADFPYPHATEDRIFVVGDVAAVLGHLSYAQMMEAVAPGVSQSLQAAFGGALIRANSRKAHVPAGHITSSLGAIEIGPGDIELYEENNMEGKRRLRALVTQDGVDFDLSVPADAARTRWLADGLASLQTDADESHQIHVRVGLSRPFPAMPNACYAQVNGLYFL